MQHVLDFTTRKELGIRLKGRESCRVIRLLHGVWTEIGQEYPLPVDSNVLVWAKADIPSSILAVALRIYELDHPGTDLRNVLTEPAEVERGGPESHPNRPRPRERRLPRSTPHHRRTQTGGS